MNKERVYYIKPFTKAWFINIWYHYKVHILIGIFVVSLLGLYTYELVTKPKYDFSLLYIGDNMSAMENEVEGLGERLNKIVPDINGDGKKKTNCRSIFASKEIAKMNPDAKAQLEEAEIEFRNGEASVYLFGGGYEQNYVEGGEGDRFYDLGELAEKYGYGEDMTKRYPDGTVYAISMENNPLLDFDTKDVCIVIRPFLGDSEKQKDVEKYEVALQMAEYIISRGEYKIQE